MKHFRLLSIGLLLLTLASCRKLIEIEETDFIGGDVALKTVNNNEQGIIGAYAAMNTEMGILLNSVMSDEVKVGEFYNSATVHEWQFASTDVTIRDNFTAISLYYRIIDRANRVLQALPTAEALRAGDEALRAKLRGEALFLRAFCHFELARYYAGNYDAAGLAMAYMEVPSIKPVARITMGPYYEKMKADMAEAKTLLPDNLTDIYRANKLAVSGLQARVALYMRNWQDAITYSTEYINAIPLASRADFPGIWTDANKAEVAFKLSRTPSIGGRIGSLYDATSASASAIGTVTWSPSDELYNAYDKTNDIRFTTYIKDEPLLSAAGRVSRLVNKYAGTAYGTPGENVADAKVFRTGEMILIRAEAKAENGDLAGAAADYNALRNARITGNTAVTFASKDEAINAIIAERFIELPFEGHRLWDLKRRGLPITRLAADAPNANATTLPANNFRFLLPIPQTALDANPLTVQNPGYER
ncbi:RagB/SusD family nutrient uptake outer membrane protein [Paracnuella aquatica]|uniref:RagB/SusD family nutrient uptake outer membrane protein n=1 Tax=Paracnuella aquatica TaxID=2268757 RepID=UPI000DEF89B7|nr:RagB/SusD family nutrient uptake outer membrane protein [Paracnuella aquatica]RPD48189.1 RagB/SusD family nutrient uptake outer membrane protein [Paracnuella aquatica]